MTAHVIVLDRTINATVEDVWNVLTDVAQEDRVRHGVSHVELLTEGPYDVGTRWREQRSLLGHHGEEELEVVESVPPRHTMVMTRLGKDRVSTSYSLTPHDHTTRLSMTLSADMSDRSPVGKALWSTWGVFDYEHTRKLLRHDLDDIAAAAEAAHLQS
ncbi:SRPBCC family protein [Nocardioides terrisoli]|uniref:SRPBCC family protein n=1 Tax=Nocardioides terrisoli TaxID=3388267 RepID=UPI00287B9EBC|nr:SRPBCC family protein [Nocardioides marmorisolisilvae]